MFLIGSRVCILPLQVTGTIIKVSGDYCTVKWFDKQGSHIKPFKFEDLAEQPELPFGEEIFNEQL